MIHKRNPNNEKCLTCGSDDLILRTAYWECMNCGMDSDNYDHIQALAANLQKCNTAFTEQNIKPCLLSRTRKVSREKIKFKKII